MRRYYIRLRIQKMVQPKYLDWVRANPLPQCTFAESADGYLDQCKVRTVDIEISLEDFKLFKSLNLTERLEVSAQLLKEHLQCKPNEERLIMCGDCDGWVTGGTMRKVNVLIYHGKSLPRNSGNFYIHDVKPIRRKLEDDC